MAKKDKIKKTEKEYIPEGMKREDYADAAFRKKVTIIMGSVLLVFVIGVVAVLVGSWYNTEQHNKAFEVAQAAFAAESDAVVKALDEIEAKSDNYDDKAQVKIEVTDDNFYNWIAALDSSYNCSDDDEIHAQYGGASIHLQGFFYTREYDGGFTQYWVCRKHSHDEHNGHNHESHEGEVTNTDEINIGELVPIEIIFLDEDQEIPKDGTWIDVTGVVGPGSVSTLSAVRYAEISIMDEPGTEYVE